MYENVPDNIKEEIESALHKLSDLKKNREAWVMVNNYSQKEKVGDISHVALWIRSRDVCASICSQNGRWRDWFEVEDRANTPLSGLFFGLGHLPDYSTFLLQVLLSKDLVGKTYVFGKSEAIFTQEQYDLLSKNLTIALGLIDNTEPGSPERILICDLYFNGMPFEQALESATSALLI